MRLTLKALLIYTVVTLLVYFGEVEKIPYAYNIGIVVVWFCILLNLFGLLIPSKELFKKKIPLEGFVRFCQGGMILFIIGVGWFWSGVFYLIAALSMYIKQVIHLKTLDGSWDEEDSTPIKDILPHCEKEKKNV